MKLDIVATDDPSIADRELILRNLVAYNDSRAGTTKLRQFALLLRDEDGATVGGLYAYAFYDWLYIDLLVVPDGHRGHGIGRELMRKAEANAADQGCVGVWLNTFSFQARGFYEKLGYDMFGMIGDHPRGFQRCFMRKVLRPALR